MSPHRLFQRSLRRAVREGLSICPQSLRFALIRRLIDCDPQPDPRLTFKIATTEAELEACFRILHDAYVAAGYMLPSPSGLRVTIYHALPTTTTLCAKFDGKVVGTISIIREGVFGFPLQSAFDLTAVRARGGKIAEISALAIDPAFRKTGGSVLFPLMKFMYQYCRELFDTRHLVIAVNPSTIQLYEALLLFERLQDRPVSRYAFANGAPAVGATLDLDRAQEAVRVAYDGRRPRKNLYRYFVDTPIANIEWPQRVLHLTNDPVMTPPLLDHFFRRRSNVFETLDERQKALLRSVYTEPAFAAVLPEAEDTAPQAIRLRRHQRFTIRCPAVLRFEDHARATEHRLTIVDLSERGCRAEASLALAHGAQGRLVVEWGRGITSDVAATVVRQHAAGQTIYLGMQIEQPDPVWRACLGALQSGLTTGDLSSLAQDLGQPGAIPPKRAVAPATA